MEGTMGIIDAMKLINPWKVEECLMDKAPTTGVRCFMEGPILRAL